MILNNSFKSISKKMFIAAILSLILFSCAAVQESEKTDSANTTSTYVFDDVAISDSTNNSVAETTIVINEPKVEVQEKVSKIYKVQIGAFTTQEKAEIFMKKFKDKIDYDLSVHFNDVNKLHVIQLQPFTTREEADRVRDELRTIPELEGTFIVY